MKRRVTARCAAANNDEDSESGSEGETPARRSRKEAPAGVADKIGKAIAQRPAGGTIESGRRAGKKAKEFAWMDSEDEDEDERKSDNRSDDEAAEGDKEVEGDENAEINVSTLDEVQNFGRMMLLTPALRKRLRSGGMGSAEVAAACRALGRTKFFDGELFEDLHEVLQQRLQGDKLDALQTNDALVCLATLNAYDKGVFSAVAKVFRQKTALIDAGMRDLWLQVFRGCGHELEKDFIQLLEQPPSPLPLTVRCRFHARGYCAVGAACTFSHDPGAPISLEGDSLARTSTRVVLTQNQETLGRGTYGRPGFAPQPTVRS